MTGALTLALAGIYLATTTAHPGQTVDAFISTEEATCTVRVVDDVTGASVAEHTGVDCSAQVTNADPPTEGAGWTRAFAVTAPAPGVYRVEIDPPTPEVPVGAIPGVHLTHRAPLYVLPEEPSSDVLVVAESPTSHAYNAVGGASYYTTPYVVTVHYDRPGWNWTHHAEGRRAFDFVDTEGFSVEIADADLVENDPQRLASYRLVLIPGKTEYVTGAFRDALDDYVAQGGRVLAIAHELSCFQSRREGRMRVTFKNPGRGPDPVLLDADPSNDGLAAYEFARVGRPATHFFGVSYWLGGQIESETGWAAYRSDHWLFEGTGLSDGDLFGLLSPGQLLDGTSVIFDPDLGLPFVTNVTQTETSPDFMPLAVAPTVEVKPWWCWLVTGTKALCGEPGYGVAGIRQTPGGGIVLVIPDGRWFRNPMWTDPTLRQITRNAVTMLVQAGPVDAYDGYEPVPEPSGPLGLLTGTVLLALLRSRSSRL